MTTDMKRTDLKFPIKKRKRRPSPPVSRETFPWLLAVAVTTIAPHFTHLPLWLSLVIATILLWRSSIWWKKRPNPSRLVIFITIFVSVTSILVEYRTIFGRDAGVALLSLFSVLKLLELKTRRDATLIIMLGYFLLLTHYLYSQDIFTGIWMLISAIIVTGALIRLNGGYGNFRRTLGEAALLLIQALPFMLALFVLFPRIPGPLWALPRDAKAGMTGLSDSMSPGSLDTLIQSDSIAFRVLFHGLIPAKQNLYWRGPVFDDFDGKTWRTRSIFVPPAQIEPLGQTVSYTVTFEPASHLWLLPLDAPTRLPQGARLSHSWVATTEKIQTTRARYDWQSALHYRANVSEHRWALAQALRLPNDDNPKARALAAEWREQTQDPIELASRAFDYFHQQEFFYTLKARGSEIDPIDDFLFTSRRGFCEHYASAFVFLMRAAQVPARVVTGYQGGEINPVDGYLVVRQADAHAWAEIWVENRGWIRYDPTAAVSPDRIEQGISAALPEAGELPFLLRSNSDWIRVLRYRWEAMNNFWNQWILGYNDEVQKEFLARLGLNNPNWMKMIIALTLFCGLFAISLMAWALRPPQNADRLQRAWLAFVGRLDRLGIKHPDWEGPKALADRIARDYPEVADTVAEASQHYIAARYGRGNPEATSIVVACRRRLPVRLARNKRPSSSTDKPGEH